MNLEEKNKQAEAKKRKLQVGLLSEHPAAVLASKKSFLYFDDFFATYSNFFNILYDIILII